MCDAGFIIYTIPISVRACFCAPYSFMQLICLLLYLLLFFLLYFNSVLDTWQDNFPAFLISFLHLSFNWRTIISRLRLGAMKAISRGDTRIFRSLWRMLSRFRTIWIPQGLPIEHQMSRAKLTFSHFRMWENQTINYRSNSDQKVKFLGRLYMYTHTSIYIHIFAAAKACPTLCDRWTVARQAPLSMGFPRLEHWSGLLVPSPGDLPDPGTELASLARAGRFFTTEPPGKHIYLCTHMRL